MLSIVGHTADPSRDLAINLFQCVISVALFVLKEDNALKSTILEKDANREFIVFVFVGKHAKDNLLLLL